MIETAISYALIGLSWVALAWCVYAAAFIVIRFPFTR